jgi:hypothetical protein
LASFSRTGIGRIGRTLLMPVFCRRQCHARQHRAALMATPNRLPSAGSIRPVAHACPRQRLGTFAEGWALELAGLRPVVKIAICASLPPTLEPPARQLGIARRVLDVAVPQVVLQRTGVPPIIGQLVARSVPQHVGMNRERKRARCADPCQRLADAGFGDRRLALGWDTCLPSGCLCRKRRAARSSSPPGGCTDGTPRFRRVTCSSLEGNRSAMAMTTCRATPSPNPGSGNGSG